MKTSAAILATGAMLVALSFGSFRALAASTSSAIPGAAGSRQLPAAASPGQQTQWGHITSLTRKGRRFEMKFDPAWMLHGVTAERAALEDTGSTDVPNDYYVVDETHRLLTYVVRPTARVTVLTRGIHAQRITVSELAQIVKRKNPRHRRLMEPKAGFWIRVGDKYPNPVLSLDQQYQP
jgi:hypothetical protein